MSDYDFERNLKVKCIELAIESGAPYVDIINRAKDIEGYITGSQAVHDNQVLPSGTRHKD